MKFEHLDWDSNFFNYKIAKIESKSYSIELLNKIEELKLKGYTLIYFFSEKEIDNSNPILKNFNGTLVDKKVTYLKKIKNNGSNKVDTTIEKYDSELIDVNLLKLAIQSGEFSRFKIDKKIDDKKFKELYKIWMRNSIEKKNAKEIFVYSENKILGFVSLGEKNNRADIGLLSVNSFYRGKGIGSKLMISAENWAVNQNYKEIQVVTQKDNTKACFFYDKCNYRVEKIEFIYHFWLK